MCLINSPIKKFHQNVCFYLFFLRHTKLLNLLNGLFWNEKIGWSSVQNESRRDTTVSQRHRKILMCVSSCLLVRGSSHGFIWAVCQTQKTTNRWRRRPLSYCCFQLWCHYYVIMRSTGVFWRDATQCLEGCPESTLCEPIREETSQTVADSEYVDLKRLLDFSTLCTWTLKSSLNIINVDSATHRQ